MQRYQYFIMKVNYGGSLLNASIVNRDNTEALLWVSYKDADAKKLLESRDSLGFCSGTANFIPVEYKNSKADLLYMAWACHKKNRQECRVVTFDSSFVRIWKITDDLRPLEEADAERMLAVIEKVYRANKIWRIFRVAAN